MSDPGAPPTEPSAGPSRAPAVGEGHPGIPAGPTVEDWPAQAADWIVVKVDRVRDATTGPAIQAARVVVYGTAIAILTVPVLIILLLFAMRGLERALIALGLDDPMWIVYLVFGGLFVLSGLLLWRRSGTTRPDPRG